MKRKFDLGCGHLGNGLLVWNRAREVSGDYEKVAHIGPDRSIKYYVSNPPKEVTDYVERQSQSDPSVSSTQPEKKVFHD